MADDLIEKSRTPKEVAWSVVRTAVFSGLIPIWYMTYTDYRSNHDSSRIWAGIALTVVIVTVLGGGVLLGLRRLRPRQR